MLATYVKANAIDQKITRQYLYSVDKKRSMVSLMQIKKAGKIQPESDNELF